VPSIDLNHNILILWLHRLMTVPFPPTGFFTYHNFFTCHNKKQLMEGLLDKVFGGYECSGGMTPILPTTS